MEVIPFGATRHGVPVDKIILRNAYLRCDLLTYGAAIGNLLVPSRNGEMLDIILGFDDIAAYEQQDKYIGAVIGRCANRIAGGGFLLDGERVVLSRNEGENHLHGGYCGFDKCVWTIERTDTASINPKDRSKDLSNDNHSNSLNGANGINGESGLNGQRVTGGGTGLNPVNADEDAVSLRYISADSEEGYPGTLEVTVTYALSGHTLRVLYHAVTDRPTPCNLTSHAYFNLHGHHHGDAMSQILLLYADNYTPVVSGSIPTGEIIPVTGTPFDFRTPARISARIDEAHPQLKRCGGYDHNWIVHGEPGHLRPAARVYSDRSGVVMDVETTMPGIQFYAGNYLAGCPSGKGGAIYSRRSGIALETQFYPDTPNHEHFPSCILRPGEEYRQETVFRFSTG